MVRNSRNGIKPFMPTTYLLWLIAAVSLLCQFDFTKAQDKSLNTKIVGGSPASLNNTRHQISLRLIRSETTPGNGMKCGGSLFTRRAVVTAAHCMYENLSNGAYRLYKPNELLVVMGQLLLTTYPHVMSRRLHNITVHPSYNHQFRFDVAVLVLADPVPSDHALVGPIPLAQTMVADGTVCQATGWGTMAFGPYERLSNALLTVDIPIVNKTLCNRSYEGILDAAMICAGDFKLGKKDACQGDSGGPLVCDGVLIGVVSFGYECGLPEYPGIYVDVSYYRKWIVENDASSVTGGWFMLALIPAVFAAASIIRGI